MTNPRDLRALAERYRHMVFGFTDRRAINALSELAAEYASQADRLEAACGHRAVAKASPWAPLEVNAGTLAGGRRES